MMPISLCGADYNYKVLRKSIPLSRQVKDTHTIYEIRYNYDLHGETLQIPYDCLLKFEGGHIINGTICFNVTTIESSYKGVFRNISVEGVIANREVWLSWWDLAYDKKYNDAILVNQIIESIDDCVFFYDIQGDLFVGGDVTEEVPGEIITFANKNDLRVIQPTKFFTVLRGRSKGGHVISCCDNKYISINGLKIDGANISFHEQGENGIGVTGNMRALIENCVIKNCYSNCFDKSANGRLLSSGYPEWGAGGKGIQIEGGEIATQVSIKNNSIRDCYIGISNNASHNENIIIDGNFIDSCYMSLILMRLNPRFQMNVNVDNTIISNNTGDVGVICMGNASNVCISNTQIKGDKPVKSIIRGCYSYSNIQLIVNQKCNYLIDAALYRDNPEGEDAINNYVKIIYDQLCDNIINISSIVPKKDGSLYANYMGGVFDITLPGKVTSTPIVLPLINRTSEYSIHFKDRTIKGDMETVNRSCK